MPAKLRFHWRAAILRLAGFLVKTLVALFLIGILAIVAFIVYPYTRPAAKTVRAVETIAIPVPFRLTLPGSSRFRRSSPYIPVTEQVTRIRPGAILGLRE
jgi:hypothetical protein